MPEAVVIGGGPAGAMAATLLARAGREVLLLERDPAPAERICGEFLSREALEDLDRLGVSPLALGAPPIATVRLLHGAARAEAPLPFRAASLSRRVLDAAMLEAAAAAGARVRRGASVRALAPEGLLLDGAEAEPLRAAAVLLATGKHDLRGARRALRRPPPDLVGFKTHLQLSPAEARALEGTVEVLLLRGCYAGLQPIEGGRANLCLLAHRRRLLACGGTWPALLASLCAESPALARRLDGARELLPRPLTIARVPYGFLHRAPERPGLYRLGDQMAVIPSFCGDGISIALHSAAAAARAVLAGEGPDAHHRRMRADAGGPVRLATLLAAAGSTSAGARLLVAAFGAWPGGMRVVAGMTRVR